jgi:hypothetical protein
MHFTYSSDMVGQARLWLQTLRATSYKLTLEDGLMIPYTNPMSVEQACRLHGTARLLYGAPTLASLQKARKQTP